MPRYTVTKSNRGYGYGIRDAQPRYQSGEDVEGVGWCPYNPPRHLLAVFGYYKRKVDAEERCALLNRVGCGPA